ncbi:MAG TPA: hypothetical protein VJ483_07105 [Holophagaceae bacterium]|nr:hypothetical protein [Holophagaceae bacterium]
MSITDTILADHEARKDAEGITWFTEDDLHRLGLQDRLFTVMQTVQHTLKLRRALQAVESGGCTDRWSVRDL